MPLPIFRIVKINDYTVPEQVAPSQKLTTLELPITYGGEPIPTKTDLYSGLEWKFTDPKTVEVIDAFVWGLAYPNERPRYSTRITLVIKNVGDMAGECYIDVFENVQLSIPLGTIRPGEEVRISLDLDFNSASPTGEYEGKPVWGIGINVRNVYRSEYSPTGIYNDAVINIFLVPIRHATLLKIVKPPESYETTTGYIGPPTKLDWSIDVANRDPGSGRFVIRYYIKKGNEYIKVFESSEQSIGPYGHTVVKFLLDMCRIGLYDPGSYEFRCEVYNIDYRCVDDVLTGRIRIEVAEARISNIAIENLLGRLAVPVPDRVIAEPGQHISWEPLVTFVGKDYTTLRDITVQLVTEDGKVLASARPEPILFTWINKYLGYVTYLDFDLPQEEGHLHARLIARNRARCNQVDYSHDIVFILTSNPPKIELVNYQHEAETEPGRPVKYWIELENRGGMEAEVWLVQLFEGNIKTVSTRLSPGERKKIYLTAMVYAPGTYTATTLVFDRTRYLLVARAETKIIAKQPTHPTQLPPRPTKPIAPTQTPTPTPTQTQRPQTHLTKPTEKKLPTHEILAVAGIAIGILALLKLLKH